MSILLLSTNLLGDEAYIQVENLVPPDTPQTFRICPEELIADDVSWAVGEWNRALALYGTPVKMEVGDANCTARIISVDSPLQGESGGTIEIPLREGVNTSQLTEQLRFWMLGEFKVTVWRAEDVRLRRAIILHELGHVLLLAHIVGFRGLGPKPVMLDNMDPNNPPTALTDLDAYHAWLAYSFCRERACGMLHVRMPNPLLTSLVATSTSAVVAAVLAGVGGGRVGGRGKG
ncbi:MAG: hypothetical protein QXD32_04550 [Nitrososphaerota archaeon]